MDKEEEADWETTFSTPSYSVVGPFGGETAMKKLAVRAMIYEDRFFKIEEQLFCDKTTEKTVEVRVRFSF